MNTYKMMLRPASNFTLPHGIKWEYVAAPWDLAYRRTDLPRADNRHGVISVDRALTADELQQFGLQSA